MTVDGSETASEPEPLAPKKITDQFSQLEAGEAIRVNGRQRTYEVIDTDTYSIIAEDSAGRQITISQNLQSGGWTINEEVFHVETDRD